MDHTLGSAIIINVALIFVAASLHLLADAALGLGQSAFAAQEAARKYSSNIRRFQDATARFASQEFETEL